jgi:hypothetical protein
LNESDLSLWQLLCLRLFGNVEVGEIRRSGGSVKLYAFRCDKHGLQTDTAHGHGEYVYCKDCENEARHVRFKVRAT